METEQLHPAASEFRSWDFVVDVDPTAGTPHLGVDDTWYPMEWVGPAVVDREVWIRRARIRLTGPDAVAPVTGGTDVAAGTHRLEWKITGLGDEIIARPLGRLEVRRD